MSVYPPTCPAACTGEIPIVSFDNCVPEIHYGEIRHIYVMAGSGAPLVIADLAEWTARIDNSGTGNVDDIRDLTVSADLPVPEQTEILISDNRKIYGKKNFVINADIDDVTDANYEFMRTMECGVTIRMWYATEDLMFGGFEGIEAYVKFGYAIERGYDTIHKITGTITWLSQYSPERVTNPMA
jgi:hypothetical protein